MGGSMTKILPGLYLGGWRNATDDETLASVGVTHILTIVDVNKKLTEKPNITYLRLTACDDPSQKIKHFFPKSNNFIHKSRAQGGICLVHCLAGVSRSVTLTVAYLMTLCNLNDVHALNAVRGFRNAASPNYGFKCELKQFYLELSFERERFLYEHGNWEFLERDLRILRRGQKNYELFVKNGYYGNLTADDDGGEEEEEGNGVDAGDPLNDSNQRHQGGVMFVIPHNLDPTEIDQNLVEKRENSTNDNEDKDDNNLPCSTNNLPDVGSIDNTKNYTIVDDVNQLK